ncbi:MAG: hypothetical protein M0Z41_03300 [Peptococcaceae bacterium]|jgi:hypothetical protein|nr:hypothetical protein [Peptococcaceae bacterium]
MNIETMFGRLFKVQTRVQLVSGKLIVRFSYFKDQEIIMERCRDPKKKLLRDKIDPRLPWLCIAQLELHL